MDRQAYLDQIDRVNREGTYKPDWDSLAEHPIPVWYADQKFGIFIHWGVYTVPQFDNEWYSRNMYMQGSRAFAHHVQTYGTQDQFGYKDLIPLFTAEKFDAARWAKLFRQAGAQYVTPVAEHHDGFQMYQSALSHWNALEMGPRRDVLGELKQAIEAENLMFCTSSHRAEHWFFMGHGRDFDSDVKEPMQLGDFYWPAQPEGVHYDLYSTPTPTEAFLTDWLLRCCELVDQYRPKALYFDWWIQHSSIKPYLKRLAAYYYNRAEEWGTGCVIQYKFDAFPMGCAVPDIERGQLAEAKPYLWQSDTSTARNSWCYTTENDYKDTREILWDLVDVVSKNGRMLLNIGPMANGEIAPQDEKILTGVGQWLAQNGEAIYRTRPWRLSQEGPTKTVEGHFTDGQSKHFTSKDIRYTCRGAHIYATVMHWPEDGSVHLTALGAVDQAKSPPFCGIVQGVEALGFAGALSWSRDEAALHVQAPALTSDLPVVLKINID